MVNFLNGKRNVDYQMHTRLWIALQVGCIYYFQCADKIQNSLLIHKLKVIKPGYWCQKWHHINYWFSITGVGHCKKKKSRIFFFYFPLCVGNNELSACILYKTMQFLHKHQAFYFRCKMFLSKEMKLFSTFMLKALQGTPYTLLVYLSRAAFILLANQPGWNVIFYYWTPSRNFRK